MTGIIFNVFSSATPPRLAAMPLNIVLLLIPVHIPLAFANAFTPDAVGQLLLSPVIVPFKETLVSASCELVVREHSTSSVALDVLKINVSVTEKDPVVSSTCWVLAWFLLAYPGSKSKTPPALS